MGMGGLCDFCLLVNQIQAKETDCGACGFGHGDVFFVQEVACDDQGDGKQSGFDDVAGIHVPSDFVHVDTAGLQADDGKPQDKSGPVDIPARGKKILSAAGQEENACRNCGPYQIGNRQGCEGVQGLRRGFRANLIKNVGKDGQCDGPKHIDAHKYLLFSVSTKNATPSGGNLKSLS